MGAKQAVNEIDFSHLDAIDLRLSHERERLRAAKTPNEKLFRQVQVTGAEKERKDELSFLNKKYGYVEQQVSDDIYDDELLSMINS